MDVDSSSRRPGLFALAFGSGFAVLTIEIAGARLIAPVFGLSAGPWTAVIGVILSALAAGSHYGGRLADGGRIPLSRILMVAGLTGVLPIVGAGVPWVARSAFGFIPGAVVSALVLFAPSVFCLGAVVPYLVRADTDSVDEVGRRAGDVSAAATAGSIAGSFTTGFFLLPAMPLPLLMGLTVAGLFAMAVAAGRILRGPDAPRGATTGAALAVLAAPGLGLLASGAPPDTLHVEQTLYTSVRVTEREWADGRTVRELWQNGGSSSAEYVGTGEPAHTYATASLDILEPFMVEMDRVLVLGGAALTLPVAFQKLHARRRFGSEDPP
ncbi:MAG: fused MFS/spermidine synthase, partial [Longimicrobiales bacterium]|nr:fused MFS/spermidine synthase [Longimicrobiales bacterium]